MSNPPGKLALKEIANKKVLITGASGFVGYNLAKKLCELGAIVFGTSRIARQNGNKNFTWLQCSFEHEQETKRILEQVKPDIIYHFSGEVTASDDIKLVYPTFKSLVASTINILTEAARLHCERVILTGSCTEPIGVDEAASSPYAAAKTATRTYGKMFWQCYNTPVVVVRPFVGYGPGQSVEKLIPHVISSFLNNESPKLTSGSWLSDWTYIEDIIEGIILSTITPGIEGSTIDLGTGILTSVKDVVLEIKKITGSQADPHFGALPDRPNESVRLAEIEETFAKLNWRAKTSLHDGLKKTVNAINNC